ncbi:hypothetical protein IC582_026713 [Cucumis melo]
MAAKPSLDSDDEDFGAIASKQLRDFMDVLSMESDLELAYNLQLEEALVASLASSSSSSSIPRPEVQDFERVGIPRIGTLHSRDIEKCDRIFQDWLQTEFDMRRTGGERHRQGQNHGFAREILNIHDDNWRDQSDTSRKPFGEGCSNGVEDRGVFKLYFKGLVSEEEIGNEKRVVAGIGVAICNPEDKLVVEVKRRLAGNERSKIVAELKALIAGLNVAMDLKLKRLCFYCDYYPLFQFITGRWPPKQRKVAALLSQLAHLRVRFDSCSHVHVARNDIKYAFKLARDAIGPQVTQTEVPAPKKKLNETCVICLEDCDVSRMFAVDGCSHRYCFSCMKQHVEVKLLQGLVPKCPHDGCKFDLNVDSCAKFLTPKDMATLRQRIKEASIPVSEKVYCPYPRCSALMTKVEVLTYTKDVFSAANQSGVRKCMKCHGLFCINCKVPWHNRITCNDYKRSNNLPTEDVKLKSLASTCLWRQCVKCNHMIELAEGCYHMTCRCGHEFCYKCGAEWKNKKATCSCPLWAENHIWHDDDDDRDSDHDDQYYEDEEELYDSEDEYFILFG